MAKGLIVAIALGLVAALSWANWPEAQLPERARADRIVLRKSEHVLEAAFSRSSVLNPDSARPGERAIGKPQVFYL
jgi:hypothetical protein